MQELIDKIQEVRRCFEQAVRDTDNLKNLEVIRLDYLGKQGRILDLLKEVKNLSIDDKKIIGPMLNELRQVAEDSLKQKRDDLIAHTAHVAEMKKKHFDVTATRHEPLKGHLHPFSQFIEELEDIFISLGYEVIDGPELESDFYNFVSLNIPTDHPARDMYDTFWVNKKDHLLRTHTSTLQAHVMQTKKLPIAVVQPGRVYRHEAVDASHDFMFMQCEGVFIAENVTLSHMFATAQAFLKMLFKKDSLDIRIRPGYFPFVEPGVEIDMRCQFCSSGCSVCKRSTWLEVFPGGLIHPNVLRAGGIDPNKYSGFAFGFGLTRLAMLRYGINDIRYLYGGKTKFLEQF